GTTVPYSATINWGDGANANPDISAAAVTRNADGSFSVSGLGDHAYAKKGSHTIAITIHDIGGATATVTATARVDVLAFEPDPTSPDANDLVVAGNTIVFSTVDWMGDIQVSINGVTFGP